jgi:hypothetical protein
MLICLAGCVLLFFPWAEAHIVMFDRAAPQTPPPKGPSSYVTLYGFQLWGGLATAATYLTALILLVITGPLQPIPAWRSAALLACGVAALGATVGVIAYPPEALRSSPEAGRLVVALGWGYVHLAALGVASGLVLLAALELRQYVARLRDGAKASSQTPAEPGRASPERSSRA